MPDINFLNLGWQSYLIIVMGCFLISGVVTTVAMQGDIDSLEKERDELFDEYFELDQQFNEFLDELEAVLDQLPLTIKAADFLDEVLKKSGFQTPDHN